MYVNMSNAPIDPDLVPAGVDAHTTDACYGKAFAYGTPIDGRGAKLTVDLAYLFVRMGCKDKECRTVLKRQGKKKVFLDAHKGFILNKLPQDLPKGIVYGDIRREAKNGALGINSWVQEVVPVQVFIIGDVCIAGVPGELTTHAGEALADVVEKSLAGRGVHEVILSTYANAYIGYITTRKGYECQTYEGGHTIFGPWELAAFQTAFRRLGAFVTQPDRKGHEPQPAVRPLFDVREVAGRMFLGAQDSPAPRDPDPCGH